MKHSKTKQNDLADKVRRCYQFERNQYLCQCERPANYRVPACWDADSTESREGSVWHKLAHFCRRRGVDPLRYVQWCLSMGQLLLGPPPEPNQLLSPRRMDAYEISRPKRREEIRVLLRVEKAAAKRHFAYLKATGRSPEDAWAATLLDDSLGLSPLFRRAIALARGGKRFRKIAREFEAGALLQYQYDATDYDDCWGSNFVPPGFAERAAGFYDWLLAGKPRARH